MGWMLILPIAAIGFAVGFYLLWKIPKAQSPDIQPGEFRVQTSSRGKPIPIVQGRREVAGNLIWYANFRAHPQFQQPQGGGKGGGGSPGAVKTGYHYTVSFAIAWCHGPAEVINLYRGKDLVPPAANIRHYTGSTTQMPDPHIAHFVPRTPAFRDVCYTVFENFDLGPSTFLPNFNAEIGTGSWTSDHHFVREWTLLPLPGASGVPGGPIRIHIFNNEIYVAGSWSSRIHVYSLTGSFLRIWGDTGTAAGQLNVPWGIFVFNNEIYVTERNNRRVQVFSLTGTALRMWGSFGTAAGQFNSPQDIFVFNNEVYIADAGNHRIQVFSLTGTFLRMWGSSGTAAGQFQGIFGLWIFNNEVYVLDRDNRRVQVFSLTGTFLRMWAASAVGAGVLDGIHIFNNEAYLADAHTSWVQVRCPFTGTLLRTWRRHGVHATMDWNPVSIFAFGNELYLSAFRFNQIFVHSITPRFVPVNEDLPPPAIARTLLTNTIFGLALPESQLDLPSFTATESYCTSHNLLMTQVVQQETSVLDILQRIAFHHGGFLTYTAGRIGYRQMQAETVTQHLNVDVDVIRKTDPISISRPGVRDLRNRLIASYTMRADRYSGGTVVANDENSQREVGLRVGQLELGGFTNAARTAMRTHELLAQATNLRTEINFEVGLRALARVTPGAVLGITDEMQGITAMPVRIVSTSESKEGKISVKAFFEPEHVVATQPTPSLQTWAPPVMGGVPASVRHPMVKEMPALAMQDANEMLVQFSAGTGDNWAGATIHRSFDGATYTAVQSVFGSGLTGRIDSVTPDEITVTVTDTTISLQSVADVFALLLQPNINLCWVEESNSYFRFARATLIAAGQWRLGGIIWHPFLASTLRHSAVAGQHISFLTYKLMPTRVPVGIYRRSSNVHFKIASFNFFGESQDLAHVAPITRAFEALGSRPVVPQNLEISGRGGITRVPGGSDLPFSWHSCNRLSRGLDFTRTNQITEDVDFVRFDVSVRVGGALRRSASTAATSWTYTVADRAADGNPTAFTVEIVKRGQQNVSFPTTLAITIV